MKFEKNIKSEPKIPTASMGDIVFLLLIFFMVTTVFKTEDGLPVNLPRAQTGQELKRDLIANVYVDRHGRISVNDKIVASSQVGPLMAQKFRDNPLTIVAFQTDSHTRYQVMDDIMEELKRVNAVRISFNNKPEGT
jgi:biopolymer transport protein ExbD